MVLQLFSLEVQRPKGKIRNQPPPLQQILEKFQDLCEEHKS